MPYAQKYQDYSDFLRSKRITTAAKANNGADVRKFRALTRFDWYDPNLVTETGINRNDYIRKVPHSHNIFASTKFKASRVAYFN